MAVLRPNKITTYIEHGRADVLRLNKILIYKNMAVLSELASVLNPIKYQHSQNMVVLSVLALRPNKIPTYIEHGRIKRTNFQKPNKMPTF